MKLITCLTILICFSSLLRAQEPVFTPGGGTLGTGNSPYSIGQTMHTNTMKSNGSVTSDSQHSYEISVVTGMEKRQSN